MNQWIFSIYINRGTSIGHFLNIYICRYSETHYINWKLKGNTNPSKKARRFLKKLFHMLKNVMALYMKAALGKTNILSTFQKLMVNRNYIFPWHLTIFINLKLLHLTSHIVTKFLCHLSLKNFLLLILMHMLFLFKI